VWDHSRIAGWPEQAVYHGHGGLAVLARDFFEPWQEVSLEPHEARREAGIDG
jgi:hypothetical protein